MLRNLENVLVNGVMTYKDPVAFRFFENVEIPFRDAGEYKVCVHTKEVDNALKIAHNYLGDKYIKLLSNKYNLYGQPEIVNGVDNESTNWHNDLKEGANLAILMYFTNASNKEQGGSISVRNRHTKEISCMLHPGQTDIVILNHTSHFEHKVGEWKFIPGNSERIVGCFDFNI